MRDRTHRAVLVPFPLRNAKTRGRSQSTEVWVVWWDDPIARSVRVTPFLQVRSWNRDRVVQVVLTNKVKRRVASRTATREGDIGWWHLSGSSKSVRIRPSTILEARHYTLSTSPTWEWDHTCPGRAINSLYPYFSAPKFPVAVFPCSRPLEVPPTHGCVPQHPTAVYHGRLRLRVTS